MIRKIQIENFQSHKSTELDLCDGVNVIVGDSDCGKSAIIRALFWTVFGVPSGTSIIRKSATDCSVSIETKNGILRKVRGKKTNRYELNDQTYEAFGRTIPDNIVDFLNLDEINFSRQMDPPFLLSKSSGEVSAYLNKLVDLEVIDSSARRINSDVRSTLKDIHDTEDNMKQLEKEVESYSWTDIADKYIQDIEELENTSDKLRDKIKTIQRLVTEIRTLEKNKQKTQWSVKCQKLVNKINSILHEMQQASSYIVTLENILEIIEQQKRTLAHKNETKMQEKAISTISQELEEISLLQKQESELLATIELVANSKKKYTEAISIHKKAAIVLQQHMPATCPLCGQDMRRK